MKTIVRWGQARTDYSSTLVRCLVILLCTGFFIPEMQAADMKPLFESGQTKCYNNTVEIECPSPGQHFYGQDGNYNIGPAMTYRDNGDGTVTDLNSSLVWQKAHDNTRRPWDTAVAYCNNLVLGGRKDWRLPNKLELETLTDMSRVNPAINISMFPNTHPSFFWSSTTDVTYTPGAWIVDFGEGGSNAVGKHNLHHVRCVRGGS